MKEHLVMYFLIMNKKRSRLSWSVTLVVKLNALVRFGLVFIEIVTKGHNSEATLDWLLKLWICTLTYNNH